MWLKGRRIYLQSGRESPIELFVLWGGRGVLVLRSVRGVLIPATIMRNVSIRALNASAESSLYEPSSDEGNKDTCVARTS